MDKITETISDYSIHEATIGDTARSLDMEPLQFAKAMLFQPFNVVLRKISDKEHAENQDVPRLQKKVTFIPGHFKSSPQEEYGPRGADIELMIIGKFPQEEENQRARLLVGSFGTDLFNYASEVGLDLSGAYLTNLVRFHWAGKKRVEAWWKDICGWFLHQEIRILRPRHILMLGTDVSQFLLGKRLSKVRGAVIEHEFPYGVASKMVATTLDISKTPEHIPGFKRDLELLRDTIQGDAVKAKKQYNYRLIQNENELRELVTQLLQEGFSRFGVDAEWGGGPFPTGRLRSIQFSWQQGQAAYLDLRNTDLDPVFEPSIESAVEQLKRLFIRDGVEINGQNFRGDLKWFRRIGLDLLPYFKFDPMLADHHIEENRSHSLTDLALRYTDLGRYDMEVQAFLDGKSINPDADGYRQVPLGLLCPYGCKDADAVLRCSLVLEEELAKLPGQQEIFYEITMGLQPILLEMEERGMLCDVDRMIELTDIYLGHRDRLAETVKQTAAIYGLVDFNPHSVPQISALLFEHIGLRPVKATDGRNWDHYAGMPPEERKIKGIRPSTDKMVLAYLREQHPVVDQIRHYRTIDTLASRTFKSYTYDEEGRLIPESGSLLSFVDSDKRVRTRFSQLLKTWRLSSSEPNLQNLPARKEVYYHEIVGDQSIPTVRSCFMAAPGYIILEADYRQAELMTAAVLSGDDEMYEVLTNPERDIHAEQAIRMYELEWRSGDGNPKDWLKDRKLSHLRDYAKVFDFATGYQGGPYSIWLQMVEAGVNCEVDDVKKWMESYFAAYSKYADYAQWCKRQVYDPGYIEQPFGHIRHFYMTDNQEKMLSQEREASNFPIQSTVASVMNRACVNFHRVREEGNLHFFFWHQLHDGLYLEVPISEAEVMAYEVIPDQTAVEVPGYGIFLDVEISCYLRWGVAPSKNDLFSLGFNEEFVRRFSRAG